MSQQTVPQPKMNLHSIREQMIKKILMSKDVNFRKTPIASKLGLKIVQYDYSPHHDNRRADQFAILLLYNEINKNAENFLQ